MPYYGESLHCWISNTPIQERIRLAPSIIYQLVDACSVLCANDIQHTDIKPANILIRGNCVTLIDYNIYSIRGVDGWVDSVGTWCYVAPETLLYGIVRDTSMVWSIGVLLAELVYKYPLHAQVSDINSREQWQQIVLKLKDKSAHLQLSARHYQLMSTEFAMLYKKCTKWNPSKRPSYAAILNFLETSFPLAISHCVRTPNVLITLPVKCNKRSDRHECIDAIVKFCKLNVEFWRLLYRSIWLLDMSNSDAKDIVYICLSIAYIFHGYNMDEHWFKLLKRTLPLESLVDTATLMSRTLAVCEALEWRVYDKSADTLAMDMGVPVKKIVKHLPIVMKNLSDDYDGKIVADELLKASTSSDINDADCIGDQSAPNVHCSKCESVAQGANAIAES
jgi:serine/threonine protein kinase